MAGMYCATFVVYCTLYKEKYMEQFNTELKRQNNAVGAVLVN